MVLASARMAGLFDASLQPWFVEAAAFLDRSTTVMEPAEDLEVSRQPTRLGAALPTILTGHNEDDLFHALMALRLPAVTPENVHLEVALPAAGGKGGERGDNVRDTQRATQNNELIGKGKRPKEKTKMPTKKPDSARRDQHKLGTVPGHPFTGQRRVAHVC